MRIDELKKWNEEAPNDTDILGHYWMSRKIINYFEVENGKPLETDERNCLILTPEENGKTRFEFTLIGNNVDVCEMAGVATFKGSYYEFKPTDTGDTDAPKDCMLHIKIRKNSIMLSDIDNACYWHFCGNHAVINGTEFSRKQRSDDCYEGKN